MTFSNIVATVRAVHAPREPLRNTRLMKRVPAVDELRTVSLNVLLTDRAGIIITLKRCCRYPNLLT